MIKVTKSMPVLGLEEGDIFESITHLQAYAEHYGLKDVIKIVKSERTEIHYYNFDDEYATCLEEIKEKLVEVEYEKL